MKKHLILKTITLAMVVISTLTGCTEGIKKEAENLKNDINKSYKNVAEKSENIKVQVIDTVNKIEETKKDIEEAKEAVDKVFE
ncbi:MAG TPA: hypothetical protein PK398_02625 [Candidatus Gracilibacteria bacterium]|nr:hypothetical protein [Candidatus Gracilibacteria bacterium]